jgi:hypothetical protein
MNSFFKWYYGGSSLRNFQATFASGFPDRPISAIETIRRIGTFNGRYPFIRPVVLYEFI